MPDPRRPWPPSRPSRPPSLHGTTSFAFLFSRPISVRQKIEHLASTWRECAAAAAWGAAAWAVRGAGVAVVVAHGRRGRRWRHGRRWRRWCTGGAGVERCGRARAECEQQWRRLRVGRRRRRASERGSGGGCVGKRRHGIVGERRRLESGETEGEKGRRYERDTYMTSGPRVFP